MGQIQESAISKSLNYLLTAIADGYTEDLVQDFCGNIHENSGIEYSEEEKEKMESFGDDFYVCPIGEVVSYEDYGMMTPDEGFVIRMKDGSEYCVTVKKR